MFFSTLLSIWTLYAAALLTPGANSLLVCHLAIGDQTQKALFAALGVAIGSGIWAISAILGLDILFKLFPWLRVGLQILGVLYLLYLAIRIWKSGKATNTNPNPRHAISPFKAFRLGFLTNITNPKGAIFFGSIFATSFAVDQGWAIKFSAITMIFITSICWYTTLAYVFSRHKMKTAYAHKQEFISKGGALLMGAIALYLAQNAITYIA